MLLRAQLLRVRRAGLTQASLHDDVAAGALRLMGLSHKRLVASDLLRRNSQRHGSRPHAGAAADSKATSAARQDAERAAVVTADFDSSDMAVGVRIELDIVQGRAARA